QHADALLSVHGGRHPIWYSQSDCRRIGHLSRRRREVGEKPGFHAGERRGGDQSSRFGMYRDDDAVYPGASDVVERRYRKVTQNDERRMQNEEEIRDVPVLPVAPAVGETPPPLSYAIPGSIQPADSRFVCEFLPDGVRMTEPAYLF